MVSASVWHDVVSVQPAFTLFSFSLAPSTRLYSLICVTDSSFHLKQRPATPVLHTPRQFAPHAGAPPPWHQTIVKKSLKIRTVIAGRARSPLSEKKNC